MNETLFDCLTSNQNPSKVLDKFYHSKKKFRLESFLKYSDELSVSQETADDPQYIFTRKLVVTPSSLIFIPEERQLGNRVLRSYSKRYPESFIRVNFASENLSQAV